MEGRSCAERSRAERQRLRGDPDAGALARPREHLVSLGGEQALVLGYVVTHPAQLTELTLNVAFNVDKEQALFTRAQLLDWLEAEGITAAGHIPGSGFGPSVREEGRHYWQPLETTVGTLGVETLPRCSPSSEEAEREKHWSSRRDGQGRGRFAFLPRRSGATTGCGWSPPTLPSTSKKRAGHGPGEGSEGAVRPSLLTLSPRLAARDGIRTS